MVAKVFDDGNFISFFSKILIVSDLEFYTRSDTSLASLRVEYKQ